VRNNSVHCVANWPEDKQQEHRSLFSKFLDYAHVFKPMFWTGPVIPLLAGAVAAGGFLSVASLKTIFAILAYTILSAGAQALNDYTDVEIDKINKPHRPLAAGTIQLSSFLFYSLILYMIGVTMASFLGFLFLLITLLEIIPITIYSIPPFRLKRNPLTAETAYGIASGIIPAIAGWVLFKNILEFPIILLAIAMTIRRSGALICKDFEDVKGDQIHGIATFPILYGNKKAARILLLSTIAFQINIIALSALFGPGYTIPVLLGGIIMILSEMRILRDAQAAVRYTFKVGAPIFTAQVLLVAIGISGNWFY